MRVKNEPTWIAQSFSDLFLADALKAATQEAVDRGVLGAPMFFVGDQMFWGQDRMDFVREALKAAT